MATYRHKMVSRYRIGRFEFKNGILNIDPKKDPKGDSEFRALIEQLKQRDQIQIVEINEQALASLERPMSRGIRGVTSTGNIESPTTEGSLAKREDERARDKEAAEELERLRAEKAEAEQKALEEQQNGGEPNNPSTPAPTQPRQNPNVPLHLRQPNKPAS